MDHDRKRRLTLTQKTFDEVRTSEGHDINHGEAGIEKSAREFQNKEDCRIYLGVCDAYLPHSNCTYI
jgi:hypothetical protein